MRLCLKMTCIAITLLPILPLFAEEKAAKPLHELTMQTIQGKEVGLKTYKGKVLLVINVASECGYTQQYKGLQTLHDKYAAKGLAVIGVPSNEFGSQEPGSNLEITQFCKKNYGVTFDLMAKTKITGNDACALYQFLTSKEINPKTGGPVKWNFTKFLVSKEGKILARFEPGVEPDSEELTKAIEKALN
ncbi:MAG: glutathione peroxidase [Gemmataceae bacterium]